MRFISHFAFRGAKEERRRRATDYIAHKNGYKFASTFRMQATRHNDSYVVSVVTCRTRYYLRMGWGGCVLLYYMYTV